MEFEAIKEFKLREAFHRSDVTFEDFCNRYLEHSERGKFYVYDDTNEGCSTITYDTSGIGSEKILTVLNDHHIECILIKIDGKLYQLNTKCDCALLANRYIAFVEFKSNALNSSDASIEQHYEKAKNQIEQTYIQLNSDCNALGVDLSSIKRIAIAVFNKTVPDNNAMQKKFSATFLLKNHFKLVFSNEIKL